MTNTKKCPKGKAIFAAVTPESDTIVYRSSARDYTHAVAIFSPAAPRWEDSQWIGDWRSTTPVEVPEGYEVIEYARSKGQPLLSSARVGRRIMDQPAGWSIWSFHSNYELADKAGRSYNRQYRIIPTELIDDRRNA